MTSTHLLQRHPTLLAIPIGVVLLLAGCSDDRVATAPVRGTVTFNGKPLPTGTVTFVPQTPGQPYATGEIGPNGEYTLSTFEDGDGAAIGSHRVMVSAIEIADPNFPEARPLLPARFSSDQTSGLTAVVEDRKNTIDLLLENPPKSPAR